VSFGSSSGGGSGAGVATFHGGPRPGGPAGPASLIVAAGEAQASDRVSAPVFTSNEIEAAIERIRISVFHKGSSRQLPHEAPASVTTQVPDGK
jgi:hypothetical protein